MGRDKKKKNRKSRHESEYEDYSEESEEKLTHTQSKKKHKKGKYKTKHSEEYEDEDYYSEGVESKKEKKDKKKKKAKKKDKKKRSKDREYESEEYYDEGVYEDEDSEERQPKKKKKQGKDKKGKKKHREEEMSEYSDRESRSKRSKKKAKKGRRRHSSADDAEEESERSEERSSRRSKKKKHRSEKEEMSDGDRRSKKKAKKSKNKSKDEDEEDEFEEPHSIQTHDVKSESEISEYSEEDNNSENPYVFEVPDLISEDETEYTEIKIKSELANEKYLQLLNSHLSSLTEEYCPGFFTLILSVCGDSSEASTSKSSKERSFEQPQETLKILVDSEFAKEIQKKIKKLKIVEKKVPFEADPGLVQEIIDQEMEMLLEDMEGISCIMEIKEEQVHLYGFDKKLLEFYQEKLQIKLDEIAEEEEEDVEENTLPLDVEKTTKNIQKKIIKKGMKIDQNLYLRENKIMLKCTSEDYEKLNKKYQNMLSELGEVTYHPDKEFIVIIKNLIPKESNYFEYFKDMGIKSDTFPENLEENNISYKKEDDSLKIFGDEQEERSIGAEIVKFYQKISKCCIFDHENSQEFTEKLEDEGIQTSPLPEAPKCTELKYEIEMNEKAKKKLRKKISNANDIDGVYCIHEESRKSVKLYFLGNEEDEEEVEIETAKEILKPFLKNFKLGDKTVCWCFNSSQIKEMIYSNRTDFSIIQDSGLEANFLRDYEITSEEVIGTGEEVLAVRLKGSPDTIDKVFEQLEKEFSKCESQFEELDLDEKSPFFTRILENNPNILEGLQVKKSKSYWLLEFDSYRSFILTDKADVEAIKKKFKEIFDLNNHTETDFTNDKDYLTKHLADICNNHDLWLQNAAPKKFKDDQFRAKAFYCLGSTVIDSTHKNFPMAEKILEITGKSGTIYTFRGAASYKVSGLSETIQSFSKVLSNFTKETKEVEVPNSEIKYSDVKDEEKEVFKNRILHEFGCEIKVEEGKEENSVFTMTGYLPDQALKLFNEHPLFHSEIKLKKELYPKDWTNIKDTKEKETEGNLYPVDLISEEGKKIVSTINSMKDESQITNCTNFKIQEIKRYQHHLKWHNYSEAKNIVDDENAKKNLQVESWKYLFNIYRFQGHKQILEENENYCFEMKKSQKGADDKMNNTQVNWLGAQANYFTDSLACTHNIGVDTDPANANHFIVILARCSIGNTIETQSDTALRVPMINNVSYNCLNVKVGTDKVYSFYSNQKCYPEYIIKYSIA